MDIEGTVEVVSSAAPHLLGVAICIYAISVLIASARWLIASRHPLSLSSITSFSEAILVGTFFNNLISFYGVSGELGRIAWASLRTRASYSRLLAGALSERLTEAVVALFYLLIVSSMIGIKVPLFASIRVRMSEAKESIRELLNRPRDLMLLLLASVAIYALDTARILFIAMSFGIEMSVTIAMTLTLIGVVSRFVPIPAGAGVLEGGFVGTMTAFGYSVREGVMVVIGERLISTLLPSALGGLIVLRSGGVAAFKAIVRGMKNEGGVRH